MLSLKPKVADAAELCLQPWVRKMVVATALAVAATLAYPPTPASASDTATRWDSFSESSACGDPFTRTPVASRIGALDNSEAILGPFGTYFGRSVGEVRSKLRYWTVPQSGGMRIQVHAAMLPSLQKVSAGLSEHAKEGRVYPVTSAWGFTPRTIAARYHISRHAMGLAVDFNPVQNPFREDGVFISNMPKWFVDTWKEAGFCWGGDWQGSKDPMHFSWMGPGATPENDSLKPIPPKTAKTAFRGPVATHGTEFAGVMSLYAVGVIDANSNGTSDVVGLRSHPNGSVIDIALSSRGFGGRCSVGRWFVPDKSVSSADHVVFADVDGDSGQDLVALSAAGGSLAATTATRRANFEDSTKTTTGASASSVALVGADFDGDHHADLWEATTDDKLRVWRGPGFTGLIDESALPESAPTRLAAGDRDGGNRPELYALYPSANGSRIDVLAFAGGSWTTETSISLNQPIDSVVAIGAGDYDGDGRADAQVLAGNGDLLVYLGNSSTGQPPSRWFVYPNQDCDVPILLDYVGLFMDDESSVFVANIESIAEAGVTRGCNPPFNDMFCPLSDVTREQMAAFLVRALGLTESSHPGFVDVASGSTFANDIGKLATAGVTRGCNPPANDRFCPKDNVSREQMAAFLTRALDLTANDHPGFGDVPRSGTFASDIAILATAGITRGCNPPANSRYCPTDPVTRGEMAAFLDRAELGS